MGLGALLLVERQRQEKAERERAALREAEKQPKLPESFDRDSARRAIIAELGRHFRGQLFVALQNGLPSLSDAALYELYCEATEDEDSRRERHERRERAREPEPPPEPTKAEEPEPVEPAPAPEAPPPAEEPKAEEQPAPQPEPKPEGKKDGRRGR